MCVENLDGFIAGELVLYDDVPLKKDKIFECLMEQSDIDHHVLVILNVILPALLKLIQVQYADHLPGGTYEHLSSRETSSAEKHNKYPERVFAYADHVMSSKPNITTLALESHITFSLNRTSEWLLKQEGALEMVRQSRQEVRCEREKFRAREKEIRTKREIKHREEIEKKEVIEKKRIEKLEIETNQMMFYGLWQTKNQVNNEIAQLHSQKDQ
ncbi:hypothetical protein DPMN_109267 [Dreissena polymorpha]|uniref:Uncharacterized protein n=1 Tax=Dreissena polymorpha TaxID=45954 RepID=A0A9D4KAF3_DREPO|nr:hypothetical protein DPMN_109267 [Dreissena polymorpha]